MDSIDILKNQNVFNLKNASAELFFDDEGILQKITFRQRRRRRQGEELYVKNIKNGRAITDYDNDGVLQHITYETEWRRPKPQ